MTIWSIFIVYKDNPCTPGLKGYLLTSHDAPLYTLSDGFVKNPAMNAILMTVEHLQSCGGSFLSTQKRGLRKYVHAR